MILRFFRWLWKRKNYCPSCMGRGVNIASRCRNGHIICTGCADVGINKCLHHFCDDTKKYFEPKKSIDPEMSLLRDENRRLKLHIEREPPAPLVIEERELSRFREIARPRPETEWQPVPPTPRYWTDTTSAAAGNVEYSHTYPGSTGTSAATDTVTWNRD